MNIQSNASEKSWIESVAFMAAYDRCLTSERRIKLVDQVIDLISQPSLSSLKRMELFRNLLMKNQEVVSFIHALQTDSLEHDSADSSRSVQKSFQHQPRSSAGRQRVIVVADVDRNDPYTAAYVYQLISSEL